MKKLFWSAQLSEYYTAVLNNEAMAVDSLVQDLDKFPLIFATLVRWCSTGFFSAAQQQACCKLCSSGSLQHIGLPQLRSFFTQTAYCSGVRDILANLNDFHY